MSAYLRKQTYPQVIVRAVEISFLLPPPMTDAATPSGAVKDKRSPGQLLVT